MSQLIHSTMYLLMVKYLRALGQKGSHNKSGLAENDRKEDRVDPVTVLLHDKRQVAVKVQDVIEKIRIKCFHCQRLLPFAKN